MRVRYETIGGVPTRYYEGGKGYPLLLIHGVGLTSDSWFKNIPALAEYFLVVAPDLLDNGFTGSGLYKAGAPHGYMLDHLEQLVEHLDLKSFAVGGSSFGALLAILLYLRMPKRIEKLVIISSSSSLRHPEKLVPEYARTYENARAAVANPTHEVCRNRMARLFYDATRIPEELLLMQLSTNALPGAIEATDRRLKGLMDIEAIRPFTVAERLAEIAVPTLAVWGKQDPRSDYNEAMEKVRRIPHSNVVVFDQCGHWPHLEHPQKFNELVLDFLRNR